MLTPRSANSFATVAQHTLLVGDREVDVVARRGLAHRRDRQLRIRRLAWCATAVELVARRHDQIAHHRGCGRSATGALAVEHEAAGVVSLDHDGVEGPVHRRERMLSRDEGRVDAGRNPFLATRR